MKKFLVKICYTVLPVYVAALILMAYYNIVVRPNMNGDLGILGKFQTPPRIESELHKKYFSDFTNEEVLKDTVVDVLVVGDSFSREGEDAFLNYIAVKGKKVMNFYVSTNEYQTAYDLCNLGYIDSTNVKTLIVENVERELVGLLKAVKVGNDSIIKRKAYDTSKNYHEDSWSMLEMKNWLLLRLGYEEPVKKCKMSECLFSGEKGNELYFYDSDLNTFHIEKGDEKVLQEHLKLVEDKCKEKGVRVIFLVCPDKYDMYQDYISSNPYEKKTVNEDFRRLFPEKSDVIIGKEILSPLLKAGEKDIYHQNDSHWSWKAAKIVADTIMKLIDTHNIAEE